MALQYFTSKRTSSYLIVNDPLLPNGYQEKEMRACAHCGYQWEYKPGSKRLYGECFKCTGLLCAKPMCHAECVPQEQFLEREEKRQNNLVNI